MSETRRFIIESEFQRKYAVYENETSVGQAIKDLGLKRSDIYVLTKWDGGDIQEEIRKSLDKVCIYQRIQEFVYLILCVSLASNMSTRICFITPKLSLQVNWEQHGESLRKSKKTGWPSKHGDRFSTDVRV